MLRYLVLALLLTTSAAAQEVTPSFGIDPSGALRELSVRDSALNGFVPMGTLNTTTHTFLPATQPVPVEAYGAAGNSNGTTGNGRDDTAAIQACVALGQTCSLRPGATYRVTSRIDMSDGSGIVGPRNATIYADPASFTHASAAIDNRYGSTAVVLMAEGTSTPSFVPLGRATFRGFKLLLGAGDATTDGRFISGIATRNVSWLDIQGMEITGGTTGAAMMINDATGIIAGNYIHDFYDDTTWAPEFPQMLGIWIDNDAFVPLPEGGSNNLRVTGNVIRRMMVGPTQYAEDHWQPDGIGIGSNNSHDIEVDNNDISYVGKGIWILGGTHNSIHDNHISYAFNQAMYCGTNCAWNDFTGNTVYTAGAAGLMINSAANAIRDSSFNTVHGNRVYRVGDTDWSVFGAGRFDGGAGYCFMTWPDTAYAFKTTNNVFSNNYCNPDLTGSGVHTASFWRAGTPPQRNDWIDNVGLPGTEGVVKDVAGELGVYRDGLQLLGNAASAATGTSGHTLGYLDTANTIGSTIGGQVLTLKGTNETPAGTNIFFDHTRATPAVDDKIGGVVFQARDSAATDTLYATVVATTTGITDGAEAGRLDFGTAGGGTFANRLYIGAGLSVGTVNDPGSGNLRVAGSVIVGVGAVALLPTCDGTVQGMMRGVTDATVATYNAAAVGGGGFHVPVYCNGTAWVLH
jgi:hypothetical protein